ncbi:hypothetical protein KAR91_74325 [Candidatus Pacearchaeota archaeon]|nr:hypothetical protein [Candidatus Pacearchaeota archaeon]
MTDSEKLAELRKAFRLAVLCACSGDPASLADVFPRDSAIDNEMPELEAHVASFADNITITDYFKKMMEL